MKKVASKLRFQELEDFKKERDEITQAEKYRIIEKHINLDRIAQRKSLGLLTLYSEETAARD